MKLRANPGDRNIQLSSRQPPSSVQGGNLVSAASISLAPGGSYSGGQTAYATGVGFWLGMVEGVPKFSIGDDDHSLTWDGTTFTIDGTLTYPTLLTISADTSDASDTGRLQLTGGGAVSDTRGAFIQLYGNENLSGVGRAFITSGDGSDAFIQLTSGSDQLTIGASPAFSFTGEVAFSTTARPATNDAGGLGYATVSWSDLFLASGGVINWNNGNYTVTHSAGLLTFSGDITVSGVATLNGNMVLGNASTDTLTIAPNAVTWSNNPTHSGNHTFSGNLTVNGTGGNIASGTYTPTLTGVANVGASAAYACQYMRVGGVVVVSGRVDIDPTAAAQTRLGISLPIASNLAGGGGNDLAGCGARVDVTGEVVALYADTTNDRAQLEFTAVDTANRGIFFTFTYLIS